MNRKIGPVVIIVLALVLIEVLYSSFGAKRRVQLDSGHQLVMGTFARVVAVAKDSGTAKKCIEAALVEIRKVDELMSDYRDDSEISEVNRNAAKRAVQVSESTFQVLQTSLEFSKLTGGAFDITVGPLVDLFHSAEKETIAPNKEQIAQAKSKVGYQKLKLDNQNRTVKFSVDGMRVDLGGIAKGYAIDRAVQIMQTCGATGGMVDIGGDIRCFGKPAKRKEHWLIGLQDPNVPLEGPRLAGTQSSGDIVIPAQVGISTGEVLLVLKLTNAAVATSGGYRRFALIEGKKYSHIIDTKTGYSSDQLTSVTIISKNATDADALATAVSVMGAEKGLALIEELPQTEAILISSQPKPAPSEVEEFQLIKTSGAEKYVK
ncbi:MAG: FAD:protein FMN transferase [Planctomycetota bacterium]